MTKRSGLILFAANAAFLGWNLEDAARGVSPVFSLILAAIAFAALALMGWGLSEQQTSHTGE